MKHSIPTGGELVKEIPVTDTVGEVMHKVITEGKAANKARKPHNIWNDAQLIMVGLYSRARNWYSEVAYTFNK